MKMLVSDYDGTLKPFLKNASMVDIINFKLNKKAISEFMKNGNTFVITTGRNTNSIMKEIKKYKLSYDFVTSFNGAVTHDANNNLIHAKYLNTETEEVLKKLYQEKHIIEKLIAYDKDGNRNTNNRLITIGVKPNNYVELSKYFNELMLKYPNLSFERDPYYNIIWIKELTNKSSGIFDLINSGTLDINYKDIYTIGDSLSDRDMINDFNGHFIKKSHFNDIWYKEESEKSVSSLIKKIK